MSRKLLVALYAVALLLTLTAAYPLRYENRRDLSAFDPAISDRAVGGLDFLNDEDLERRGTSRKARAQARKDKGITTKPQQGKAHGANALPNGVKGAAAKQHIEDIKAAKNKKKNDARNASLAKNGKGPVAYEHSKKANKIAESKRLKKDQRIDDAEVHRIKMTGRTPKSPTQIAAEKAEHRVHLANAKAEHQQSLATGTFPLRHDRFTTAHGNTYTGKDVRQAAFTAHLAAQKPVGYKTSDGSTLRTKDRHPKEFENRIQGPPGAQSKPLPDITGTGTKYREYGILHDKMKGYDGRSPNPTEARLITKPNAHGTHEFAAVVAHPNSGGLGTNDHHIVHPSP